MQKGNRWFLCMLPKRTQSMLMLKVERECKWSSSGRSSMCKWVYWESQHCTGNNSTSIQSCLRAKRRANLLSFSNCESVKSSWGYHTLQGSTGTRLALSLHRLTPSHFTPTIIILRSLLTWHNYKENKVSDISRHPSHPNFCFCRAFSLCKFIYTTLPGGHV